jgi:hypothetical protein
MATFASICMLLASILDRSLPVSQPNVLNQGEPVHHAPARSKEGSPECTYYVQRCHGYFICRAAACLISKMCVKPCVATISRRALTMAAALSVTMHATFSVPTSSITSLMSPSRGVGPHTSILFVHRVNVSPDTPEQIIRTTNYKQSHNTPQFNKCNGRKTLPLKCLPIPAMYSPLCTLH